MTFQQKVPGQPCPKCGGKYVTNPATGKVFCENKCWLNQGDPKQAQIKQAMAEKKENIKQLNAINNACLLIANDKYPVNNGVVNTVKELATQIYQMDLDKQDTVVPSDTPVFEQPPTPNF